MSQSASATIPSDSSGNPAFNDRIVRDYLSPSATARGERTMTIGGTAAKTFVFLVVLVAAAAWGWESASKPVATDIGGGYGATTVTIPAGFWLASIVALFVGIATSLNPSRAQVLGFVYAALQGYVLGVISAAYDAQTDGIVSAAVACTIAVMLASLFLYATGIVRPTQRMAFGVAAAMGGLLLFWSFVWLVSLFGWTWSYSSNVSSVAIAVNLLVVVLAALTLTLDFQMIDRGSAAGAPKFMEWYGAYGLMVTLIWLYITILRLLAWIGASR